MDTRGVGGRGVVRRGVVRRAARGARRLAAFLLAVASAACGSASGAGDGAAGVGVDLSYTGAPSPRAEGFARTLAASSTTMPDPPSDTWLRLTVSGAGFGPIVCQFPRRTGGACSNVPAGSGRVVTVEEWDSTFGTLYYRGVVPGVVVQAGRTTRVKVPMRPPVVVQDPVADGAVNRAAFTAIVQSEPYATITLHLGAEPLRTLTADEQGVASFMVDRGGPEVPPRADGKPGLPDGDYLLTAVALPRTVPGTTPVRYQGAPHAFAVDLVPPALNLSAPTLTSEAEVPLAGVAEPGSRVRCGIEAPDEQAPVHVDSAGRFALRFPLAGTSVRIVCAARDRAGNQTTQDFVVAHLPDGFAVAVDLPDVTRVAAQTARVTTDPTVEDLRIDVVGEVAHATRSVIVAAQTEPGVFDASLPLFENQWNRVLVSARIRGQVLGAVESAVEHDNVPPRAPTADLLIPDFWTDPPVAEVVGDRIYVSSATLLVRAPVPGERMEIFRGDGHTVTGVAADGGAVITPPPSQMFGATDVGIYAVPKGDCFRVLYARTIDRAGNDSAGWSIAALGFMNALYYCVR